MSTNTDSLLAGYVTRREAARQLDVSPRTLDRWRAGNFGPPYTRLGHRIFYPLQGVTTWLSERERRPESR